MLKHSHVLNLWEKCEKFHSFCSGVVLIPSWVGNNNQVVSNLTTNFPTVLSHKSGWNNRLVGVLLPIIHVPNKNNNEIKLIKHYYRELV